MCLNKINVNINVSLSLVAWFLFFALAEFRAETVDWLVDLQKFIGNYFDNHWITEEILNSNNINILWFQHLIRKDFLLFLIPYVTDRMINQLLSNMKHINNENNW